MAAMNPSPENQTPELSRSEKAEATQLALEVVFGQTSVEEAASTVADEKERASIRSFIQAKVAALGGIHTGRNQRGEKKEDQKVELCEGLKRNLLEKQYPNMLKVLSHYEISTNGAPSLQSLTKGLTYEVLEKATQFQKPTLLLVPPTTRQSKVEALDTHKVKAQKHNASTYKIDDNDLWNGGKAESSKKWRVSIVEGVQNVEQDSRIYDGKRSNYSMTKIWMLKLKGQGLDVMNGADQYLTLMMKALGEGKPIDLGDHTVLNGKNLTKGLLVACGSWDYDIIYLIRDIPLFSNPGLRLRGSVEVDVPEA